MTGFLFGVVIINGQYSSGAILAIVLVRIPSSIMVTMASLSTWRNMHRISTDVTSHRSCAAIVDIIKIASVETVGEVNSSLEICSR